MQAGSGMQHAERVEAGFESFQIWLEPNLDEAVRREPSYSLYKAEEFPQTVQNGLKIKTVLGEGSPVHQLVSDARMFDIEVEAGVSYVHRLLPNRTLAGLSIRGNGGSFLLQGQDPLPFMNKDFAIAQTDKEDDVIIRAAGETLRIFLIEVPTEVDYPLYNKAR